MDYHVSSMEFNVHEAKTHFSRLLDLAQEGEEVVIVRNGKPVAELVPARRKGTLLLGIARGTLRNDSDDWWQAAGEEELTGWYGN